MHKDDILRFLMKSASGFVSGEELASRFKMSRAAIWKHIKALEREGCRLEAMPSKGYRLVSAPDVILLDDVKRGLRTAVVGRDILLFSEVESSNTLGMEMARTDTIEGTVIVAERQTGGKGRLGRTWISPRGNLYLSVLLRPDIPPHKAPLITLMGAVATASAVRKQIGLDAGIKWPNDIFLSGKKTGGLLTEMSAEPDRIKYIVLGIGLNVNMDLEKELPASIWKLSTTLARESGRTINRSLLLRGVIMELDRWYRRFLENDGSVITAWEDFNITLGNRVAVSGIGVNGEGMAQGIDPDGRLMLRLDDGSLRLVSSGDVTILKGWGKPKSARHR